MTSWLTRGRFDDLVLPRLEEAYRLARWLTGSASDAETIVQDAYLIAFRAVDTFTDENVRVWVLTIVRNTAFAWLGHHRPHSIPLAGEGDDVAPAEPGEVMALVEHRIGQSESERLDYAIASLQVPLKEVLILREYHGLSYKEIAEVSAVPLGTVMSRLARARQQLLACVSPATPLLQPDDSLLLLNAFQDGELSPSEALEIARRLEADADLRVTAGRLSRLSGRLGEIFAHPPLPPLLHAQVTQRLNLESPAVERVFTLARQSFLAMLLTAAIGGAVLGSGATFLALRRRAPRTGTQAAVLAGHLRALEAPQPFDVAAASPDAVKAWFIGKTTIAPAAKDLAAQGYPLAGARIDIVEGDAVPTLVYRRDTHVISVTVTRAMGARGEGHAAQSGYTIDRWVAGDLSYWAVSELDQAELARFERLFRA